MSQTLRIFSEEVTLLNTIYKLYTSNNSIIWIHHNNTGEINNSYYINIIEFIISTNRKISKITIMIIIIIHCNFVLIMNNNTGSIIIITLINTTTAILILV